MGLGAAVNASVCSCELVLEADCNLGRLHCFTVLLHALPVLNASGLEPTYCFLRLNLEVAKWGSYLSIDKKGVLMFYICAIVFVISL